jgi:hypothetical protein
VVRSRVRRRSVVAAIVVGALIGGAAVARELWLNDTARAVDTSEVLKRFREQTDPVVTPGAVTSETVPLETVPPQTASLPPLGVYTYATSGSEHIDVLGGTGHDYPKQTTVTVTRDGCGVNLRWDLLQERREDWRLCTGPDGIVWQAQGGHFYHEFFGHGELQTLVCDRPALLVPLDGAARPEVPLECHLDTQEWQPQWTVIGLDTRTVGGVAVPVTHVRMVIDMNGKYYEHTTMDYWLDTHGLPVHVAGTKTSKTNSGLVGDVVYTETISADLESLEPLR